MNKLHHMIHLAIIGIGKHSTRVLVPAADDSSRVLLKALATSSKQKAIQLLEKYPTLNVYENYEDPLDDPMIDCIYIALPNHLHHELTIKALSKRKAVICEKPVALTTSDAVSMICTSEQNASPLHAAYMYRHHPQHHVVLDELTKGSIGEPKKLIANFCYERPEKGNIRLNKAAGGGALNDAGCYLLHLSLSIFDKAPSELSASQVLDAETGVDEETKILLQYPNGQSVELKCSLSSKRQNNYKIIGTEGEISLDTAFIVPRNKQNEVLVKSISGRERRISVPPANQFKLMLDSIGQSLMEKTANPNLKQDVLAVANLLDATRVSALDNRVVAIEFS